MLGRCLEIKEIVFGIGALVTRHRFCRRDQRCVAPTGKECVSTPLGRIPCHHMFSTTIRVLRPHPARLQRRTLLGTPS